MDLRVFLKMDGSGFKQGLASAANDVEHFSNNTSKALMGKLGAVFTVGAATAFGRQVMQLASNYHRLAIQTGLSAEKVQELGQIASMSGTPVETIAQAYAKLAQNIVKARQGSQEAIKGFKGLGISTQELAVMSPDDVFQRLAKSINEIGDETEKTAALMTVLGESASNLKPFLAGYAEGKSRSKDAAKMTKEDIAVLADAKAHYAAFFGDLTTGGAKAWAVVERLHNGLGDLVDTAFDYAKVASFLWTDATPSELIEEANQKRRGRGLRYDASWGSKYAAMEFPVLGGKPADVSEYSFDWKADLLGDQNKELEIQERIKAEIFNRDLEAADLEQKRAMVKQKILDLEKRIVEERYGMGNYANAAELELESEKYRTLMQRLDKPSGSVDNVSRIRPDAGPLVSVGNFLGSSGVAIEGIGRETNKILRDQVGLLRGIRENTNRPALDIGVP